MSSWLARSIANSLIIDDHPQPSSSSSNANDVNNRSQFQKSRFDTPDHTDEQLQESEIEFQDRTGGVKEDLSEFTESLTRQLWGVASFLAPRPPQPNSSDPFVPRRDPYVSGEDDHHVSNSAYPDSRFGAKLGILDSLISDQIENVEAVGVTEEALAFASNISHHPETWLDFPLSEEEDDDDFEMSDTQWNHVTLVERLAPGLSALRIEFCPVHMSESYFWKVYFVLLHPRLKKHDADLLSTPQIVAARAAWMKELQEGSKSEQEQELSSNLLKINSFPREDFSTNSSDFPCPKVSEEDPFETQEAGLTKNLLARSCGIRVEEDDDDDWIHENTELDGYDGPDVLIGTDEEISFSDLEADDDCTMPIRSKVI